MKHHQKSDNRPAKYTKAKRVEATPTSSPVRLVEHTEILNPVNGDNLQAQTAHLNDSRWRSVVQRQILAAQIGRVQGKGHLQRGLQSRQKQNILDVTLIQRYLNIIPSDQHRLV